MRNRLVTAVVLPLYERLIGQGAWSELRRWRQLQWATPEEIEAQTAVRLRELLLHAQARVPFYRDLFAQAGFEPERLRQIADLERLPVISKLDLRAAGPERVVAQGMSAKRRIPQRTSGSTGEPFNFFGDRASLGHQIASFGLLLEWAGATLWDSRIVIAGPSWARVPSQQMPRLSASARRLLLGQELQRFSGLTFTVEQLLQSVERLGGRRYLIWAYPSFAARLARQLREQGRRLSVAPVAVLLTGEATNSTEMAAIAAALGSPVYSHFAANELSHLAQTCPDNPDSFHVHPEMGLARVVRPDGRNAAVGEIGRLVVTNLINQVTPLINYSLGDQAVLGERCRCGRGLPALASIEGRAADLVRLPDGRTLSAAGLSNHLLGREGFPQRVREFQAIQTEPARLILRLVPTEQFDEAYAGHLRDGLADLLGADLRITIEQVERIEREASGKRTIVKALADA